MERSSSFPVLLQYLHHIYTGGNLFCNKSQITLRILPCLTNPQPYGHTKSLGSLLVLVLTTEHTIARILPIKYGQKPANDGEVVLQAFTCSIADTPDARPC